MPKQVTDMIFGNRYLCLEYIPYLKSFEEKEAYAASILRYQFGSIENAEQFIKDYKLNDKDSVYYCIDTDRLKEKERGIRDCAEFIKHKLPDAALCKKMCESCVLCAKTWKLEEEFEWRYVNALYHSGLHMDVNSINRNLKSSQLFIYGSNTDKPVYFSIRLTQRLDELIRNNYKNLRKDYNADLKFLQQKISEQYEKRGKNLAAQIRKDIYIRIKAILDMKVSLEDAEYAVTILTENRRTVPTRKNIIDSMQDNLMDIKITKEDKVKDTALEIAPIENTEIKEIPIVEIIDEINLEQEGSIINTQMDLLGSIGVEVKKEAAGEADNAQNLSSDIDKIKETKKENNSNSEEQKAPVKEEKKEEAVKLAFIVDGNELIIDSKKETETFLRLRGREDIAALFDRLYDCRMISCEAVNLDNEQGIFIFGNTNFDVPVFARWEQLSNQDTNLLLNSNKYVTLTLNYEGLMQKARRKGMDAEGNCASIASAYHALHEESDIYPFGKLLKESSLSLEQSTPVTFLEIFKNYFRIYSHLKNVILDEKVLRYYKINKFYEYALSSADEMEYITRGTGINLSRLDFYTNEFRYQPWFKPRYKGTVFQLYIKDAEVISKLTHFKATLIRNIFKREPFENTKWAILYMSDSDLYLYSKQTNKEVVNHIKERIGVALADTCKAYKLKPLTFIVNIVK